jgi:hypothetical protein
MKRTSSRRSALLVGALVSAAAAPAAAQQTTDPTPPPTTAPAADAAPITDAAPAATPAPSPTPPPTPAPSTTPTAPAPAPAAPARPEPQLRPTVSFDGPGMTVSVAGFRIGLAGYIQAEYQHHDESENELSTDGMRLLNQDRFLIRHARVLLNIERDWAQLLLEPEVNTVKGTTFSVRQAEATLRYMGPASLAPRNGGPREPLVALTIGMFRTPFGYETLLSARERVWMEQSLAQQAFFPGESDLGVRLRGALGWFRYSVALVNGHPIDEARFGGQAPTQPSDVVGRLGFDAGSTRVHFTGGVSALAGNGFHPGTPATKDMLVVRDVNQSGTLTGQSLQLIPGRAATPSQTFAHWAGGLDLELSARPSRSFAFSAYAEGYVGQNMDRSVYVADPITTGFDLREFGFAVGYSQTLLDLVLMGLRVDYYNPNADAVGRQGGQLVTTSAAIFTTSFLLGVQVPHTQSRLVAQYDLVRDSLAVGDDGLPHDLANNRFTLRLQAAF